MASGLATDGAKRGSTLVLSALAEWSTWMRRTASVETVKPQQPIRGANRPAVYAAGDHVVVFARDMLGRPVIEGTAQVVAPTARPHHYRVQFIGEPYERVRFVNPEWQTHPKRSLALLRVFWGANAEASVFDDFFLEGTNQSE